LSAASKNPDPLAHAAFRADNLPGLSSGAVQQAAEKCFAMSFRTQSKEVFMPAAKLSEQQIANDLRNLKGWSVMNGNLHRVFEFKDFAHAFAFMTQVALAAEKMDHHPDWSNSWNKVTVDLCTHSAGGLTKNDFDLAGKIQQIQGG
jgi:4a-hydroxytetrahydrobiopterin dehydratase